MSRLLPIVLFILIVVGGVRSQILAALRPSWRASRTPATPYGLSIRPLRFQRDPMPPQLIAFLEDVERVTPPAATVAVLLPRPWNDPGVGYSRFRMSYLLAGHPIVIASDADDEIVKIVPYVASWHPASPPPRGSIVLSRHDGMLIRASNQ